MAHHALVMSLVLLASEEDKQLPSPFTRAPTASLVLEKEKQTKEKTSQQGSSKILSKAREKAEHDSKKVSGKILLKRVALKYNS